MLIQADLHLHSHHSDGLFSPAEIVSRAVSAGLRAMALTDHDTVDGVEEALRAAPEGLEVIPSAELSSTYRGRDIHLLAYYIDHSDQQIRDFLRPFQQERRLRAERIVARLNQAGVPVTMDEVYGIARASGSGPNGSIGRPHIADAIIRHGAASDIDDAFSRYLRRGQPAYVPRACIPVREAVKLVRSRGGALVVAHPGLNLADSDTESLAREGLDGIEVWHPKHPEEQRRRLEELAARLGLIASGGSDYHGPGRNRHEFASAGVPLQAVRRLEEAARSTRSIRP